VRRHVVSVYAATVCLLEIEIFEVKMDFDDACRLDTSPQYVLLGRHVVFSAETIQIVQKTAPPHANTSSDHIQYVMDCCFYWFYPATFDYGKIFGGSDAEQRPNTAKLLLLTIIRLSQVFP